MWTPSAEISRPPHQQAAATTPALRGPARSSQPPHSAALDPKNTKKSVYIQPRLGLSQSQVVVNSMVNSDVSEHGIGLLIPSAFVSGNQNTEKPYAMPMHK